MLSYRLGFHGCSPPPRPTDSFPSPAGWPLREGRGRARPRGSHVERPTPPPACGRPPDSANAVEGAGGAGRGSRWGGAAVLNKFCVYGTNYKLVQYTRCCWTHRPALSRTRRVATRQQARGRSGAGSNSCKSTHSSAGPAVAPPDPDSHHDTCVRCLSLPKNNATMTARQRRQQKLPVGHRQKAPAAEQ